MPSFLCSAGLSAPFCVGGRPGSCPQLYVVVEIVMYCCLSYLHDVVLVIVSVL